MVESLDYIANDTILVKNERIPLVLVSNLLSFIKGDKLAKIQNKIELLLDACYNLYEDDKTKFSIEDEIFMFFNEEAQVK